MATIGFDPSAELSALRELFAQCAVAANEAEMALLKELDEVEHLCRNLSSHCDERIAEAQREKDAAERAREIILQERDEAVANHAAQVAALAQADEILGQPKTASAPPEKSARPDAEAELREVQLEMEQLRAELKSARRRLTDEKRKSASDRDGWESELSELRKALEPARPAKESSRQPNAKADASSPAKDVAPGNAAPTAHKPVAATSDPVLGAVLAQFQKLQQPAARD